MKKQLHLFTEIFPFKGGEPFLETEILYLSKAFEKVYIYPLNANDSLLKLPENIIVKSLYRTHSKKLRQIIFNHLTILFKWFFNEIIRSPKRLIYIKNLKHLFYQLVGHIVNAEQLSSQIASDINEKSVFYSYWFNEWGSILSIVRAKNPEFQFITRVHLFDFEEEFQDRQFIPFRYTEINKPKRIIAISSYAQHYIFNKMKVPTALSYLGVNSSGLNKVGFNDSIVIVSCSSLSWYKRPLLLATLISRLNIQIKWVHFGDGVLKPEFLSAVKQLPVNIQFQFMGHVSHDEVIKYYQNQPVHLVINVSSFEGIPVSLMEAISFGIPIMGCNICGVPEIVNEQTGILLNKDFDIHQSANAIENFLITKSKDHDFRKGVRAFWENNFNADKNYPEFIQKYLLN